MKTTHLLKIRIETMILYIHLFVSWFIFKWLYLARFVSQNSSLLELNNGMSPDSIKLNKNESLIRTRNTDTKSNAVKRTMFDSLNGINKFKHQDDRFNIPKKVSFDAQNKFASAPGSPRGSVPSSPIKGHYEDTTGMSTKVSFRDVATNGIRSSGFNSPL